MYRHWRLRMRVKGGGFLSWKWLSIANAPGHWLSRIVFVLGEGARRSEKILKKKGARGLWKKSQCARRADWIWHIFWKSLNIQKYLHTKSNIWILSVCVCECVCVCVLSSLNHCINGMFTVSIHCCANFEEYGPSPSPHLLSPLSPHSHSHSHSHSPAIEAAGQRAADPQGVYMYWERSGVGGGGRERARERKGQTETEASVSPFC